MQLNITVQAPARLDGFNADDFAVHVQNLIQAGGGHLILDLGVLEYIGSAGVRALFMIQKAVAAKDGKLALLALRPSVREVLRICGADKIAPQAESISAARRLVD